MFNLFRRLQSLLRSKEPAAQDKAEEASARDTTERGEISLSYKGINFKATYQSPSVSEVESNLEPVQRARAAGALNNPPSAQRELSSDEDSIVLFFKDFLRRTEQTVFDALATLENDLQREQAIAIIPDPDRAYADLNTELRTLKMEWTGRLIEANKDRLAAWRSLRHFRSRHLINRDALYPESHIFDFALLVLLVVIEAAGNGFILTEGNDYGYTGAVLIAILISAVNVFVSFFVVGYLSLRYLNVQGLPVKPAAIAGTLIGCAAVFLLNLAAGHYRDMLTLNPNLKIVDAVAEIFRSFLWLNTLPALALMLFGLALAVLSAYKGYYYDDPLPGYGWRARRHEEAKNQQAKAEEDFRRALNDAARHHADAVEGEIRVFRRRVQRQQIMIALFDQIRTYFPDYQVNVIQRMCNATLRRYREENARVRTSAVPAAFRECPTVYVRLELPDLPAPVRDLQQQIIDLKTTDRAFTNLKERFIAKVEEFFAEIEQQIVIIENMASASLDRREPPA